MPKGVKTTDKGYAKATDAEFQHRVSQVAKWLLENPNARWTDGINWIMASFDVQQNQANIYRKEAFKKIREEQGDDDFNVARKFSIIALKNQWTKAIADKDDKLAFQIQQEINKIQGLYTHKIQIEDVSEKPIFDLTDGMDSNDSNKEDN